MDPVSGSDIGELLHRLTVLDELRRVLAPGFASGCLDRSSALRALELLKKFIEITGGVDAIAIVRVLEAFGLAIKGRSELLESIARKVCGSSEMIPMPELLIDAIPGAGLLELIAHMPPALLPLVPSTDLRRVVAGGIAEALGVDARAVEVLLSVGPRDLVRALGLLIRRALDDAAALRVALERHVLAHGIEDIAALPRDQLREAKSVLAEIVAQTWIKTVLEGPWAYASNAIVGKNEFEIDIFSYSVSGNMIKLYVGEVELSLQNFLKIEKKGERRIEVKARHIAELPRIITSSRKRIRVGLENVEFPKIPTCIEKVLLISFDEPSDEEKNSIASTVLAKLREKHALCLHREDAVQYIDLKAMKHHIETLKSRSGPHRALLERLKKAIEFISQIRNL